MMFLYQGDIYIRNNSKMNGMLFKKMKRQFLSFSNDIFFKIHLIGLYFGIQIVPNHYYSPVADVLELRKHQELWAKKSDLPGINYDIEGQLHNLKEICTPYKSEYADNENYHFATKNYFGPGYGPIEAQMLHCIIRHYKPTQIIEVGSGVSTYCAYKALDKNGKGNITCIEPFPSEKLLSFKPNIIQKKVQEIPVDFFSSLKENDLLFIDSSHTVKPGSDVNYLILEVLPRLNKGVIVHFHDIFFPYDYRLETLYTAFQWNETSLMHAFLINNNKAKIIVCLSQLHYDRTDALLGFFPEYSPLNAKNGLMENKKELLSKHFPSSMYIRIGE